MRGSPKAVVANPVLVGALTVLVVIVAVFLAYNANRGLPFVPTYQLRIEAPKAARLVVGDEVREGGYRIGQVSELEVANLPSGRAAALITTEIDESAAPVPVDSTVIIRPRSSLGLKYIDLNRGEADEYLPDGGVLTALESDVVPPELDEFFGMFSEPVREDIRTNLETFGGGFAGRGDDINRALADLPRLLAGLVPVMRVLADPDTGLERFVAELQETVTLLAPVADDLAAGFASMAAVFEALSRDPAALQAAIAEAPPTLAVGIRQLPRQLPFLRALARISDEISASAAAVRTAAPPLARALAAGTGVLPETTRLSEALETALRALRDLGRSPETTPAIQALTHTMVTLTPTLRWLGPHITVCNYWNYWWTYLSDHLSEQVDTGTLQRIGVKTAPEQDNSLAAFNQSQPANREGADPLSTALAGDPAALHNQPYGRAVDESGRADCESGQRGYPRRLAEGMPPKYDIAIDPRTPGRQGTTFTGRETVPEGQTFSEEPAGDAPVIVP